MVTIEQILKRKGDSVCALAPENTVYEALEVMADKDIGAVVVLNDGKLCGIFSERDYARKVILKGRKPHDTQLKEIMSEKVLCANKSMVVEECMALMSQKRFRHLPVLENNEVIGMISIGDLVNATIDEQKFIIEQLEHYING